VKLLDSPNSVTAYSGITREESRRPYGARLVWAQLSPGFTRAIVDLSLRDKRFGSGRITAYSSPTVIQITVGEE
jgi:hypothetical protein